MYKLFFQLLFLVTLSYSSSFANIQLIKKDNNDSNTTLLVIGGIHGDEPGGYFAASILASHYTILSKNLWIVPNLNKRSIQANRRGIHGDMNRKFSTIKKNDKDAKIVQEIKDIILSQEVSLVLNLHDGNGFYRKENKGNIFNPNSWGQTCVIDQCKLNQNQPFGNLSEIATTVKQNINTKLLQEHHSFDVRNTNTKFDDEAMRHSLTYFAVTNNKPAFAIESSKHLPSLPKKVFYQLMAIEEFMKIMDIKYTRDFELNEVSINEILQDDGNLMINNNILLKFYDIKKSLSYVPIKSTYNTFEFSSPLGSYKKVGRNFVIYNGNKKITTLKPQYFKMAQDCPETFEAEVDKELHTFNRTDHLYVNNDFKIIKNNNIRVNIIGFKSKKSIDESNITIKKTFLTKRFSVDKSNKTYRIEFYKDDKFCFMSMVHFK